MAQVETANALLIMALQDLLDGEAALLERLEGVSAACSDTVLKRIIAEDCRRSTAQHDRLMQILRELDEAPDGSRNVWLRAILDDADNDCDSIARGPLRDIALTGALRKGKQSERVSYETAFALAERLELTAAANALRNHRDEEQAADQGLARVLNRLVAALER